MTFLSDVLDTSQDMRRWSHAGGKLIAAFLYVLLGRLGRLTRWAIREGWYWPHVAIALIVSAWMWPLITPLAAPITFATLSVAWCVWRVRVFRTLPAGPARRALGATLLDLSRLTYRCWRLKRRWQLAAEIFGLSNVTTDQAPKLRSGEYLSPIRAAYVANLSSANLLLDKMLGDKMAHAAQALRLHAVNVTPVRGRPGLAKFEFLWGSRLQERQPITALPAPEPGWAAFGIGEGELTARLKLEFSTLFVGESRSGKSTAEWACVLSTIEQAALPGGWPVQFWIIDLSKTEFAAARPLTRDDRPFFTAFEGHRYADTQDEAVRMLRLLEEESKIRARQMSRDSSRKLDPTEEMPWIVLLVDEALQLVSKAAKPELGAEAIRRLITILTGSAKYGITVWAGTQASTVDLLSQIRIGFPQRVAMSTVGRHMTDAALGENATAAGATCHKFSVRHDAGRGYMAIDGESGFHPFRGVWVDDDHTRVIGRGEVPDELLEHRGQPTADEMKPGAVYLIYGPPDEAGRTELLYIGKTSEPNPWDRIRDHLYGAKRKEFADWVIEDGRFDVIDLPNFKVAGDVEADLIRKHDPPYNRVKYKLGDGGIRYDIDGLAVDAELVEDGVDAAELEGSVTG